MYDPLRLQILTLSLDSEVMLVLVGVIVAALVARGGARRLGLAPRAGSDAVVDAATWALGGARVGWVMTHLGYYGRALQPIFALGDGGYLFTTGALAVAWYCARLRRELGISWHDLGVLAGPALAAAFLFDRAGCALTGCGTGRPTDLPWALVRSGSAVHPVGLYGVVVWALAWALLGRIVRDGDRRGLAWTIALGALTADRTIAWTLGHDGVEGAAAAAALLVVHLGLRLGLVSLPARVSTAAPGG